MNPNVASHETVLRQIYEFLDASHYHCALQALQVESGVPYNVIHSGQCARSSSSSSAQPPPPLSRAHFSNAVLAGRWPEVLRGYVDGVLLPLTIKFELYEQIFYEMLWIHNTTTAARALLLNAPVFIEMRSTAPLHTSRLDNALERFDPDDPHREARVAELKRKRQGLLDRLATQLTFAEGPLSEILSSAVLEYYANADGSESGPARRRQRLEADPSTSEPAPSATVGNVASTAATTTALDEVRPMLPSELLRALPSPSEEQIAVCTAVLRCGCRDASTLFALQGFTNGELAVVNVLRGETTARCSAASDSGVYCVSLHDEVPSAAIDDGEWAAVGLRSGAVKVYSAAPTFIKLMRKFPSAHTSGVTCVVFGGPVDTRDLKGHRSLLLAGSFDGAVAVLSIRSGATLATVAEAHLGHAVVGACHLLSSVRDMALRSDGESSAPATDDADLTTTFMTSGTQGELRFWRFDEGSNAFAKLPAPFSEAMHISYVDQSFRHSSGSSSPGAAHIRLSRVGAYVESGSGSTAAFSEASINHAEVVNEVLVHVVGGAAVIVRVVCHPLVQLSETFLPSRTAVISPFALSSLCLIEPPAEQSLFSVTFASAPTGTPASTAIHPLSLFMSTRDGSVLHYSVDRIWRDPTTWAERGGGRLCLSSPLERSYAVSLSVGHTIEDLSVSCGADVTAANFHLVCLSPSLLRTFVL